MVASSLKFQIAIAGPLGSAYLSFPSTDLMISGDATLVSLANIRRRCNISNKLYFTADNQTRVEDDTSLKDYMTLTSEGQKILDDVMKPIYLAVDEQKALQDSPNPPDQQDPPPRVDANTTDTNAINTNTTDPNKSSTDTTATEPIPSTSTGGETIPGKKTTNKDVLGKAAGDVLQSASGLFSLTNSALTPKIDTVKDEEAHADSKKDATTKAGILTLQVKVMEFKSPTSKPRALPEEIGHMKKVLDNVSKSNFLERGTIPGFTDTALASLTEHYAAAVGKGYYPEPQELLEEEWDEVLKNNRAFHGYYMDYAKNVLVKASRPAFRLRSAPAPGILAGIGMKKKLPNYNPPIPPYYINDTSSVSVVEVKDQFQSKLVKEGFDALSVSGSIGGGTNIPVSVSASFDQEHQQTTITQKQTSTTDLSVTYNFPRVVIEFESYDLELTPECANAARAISSDTGVTNFKRRYGTIFATAFTLGGYLHSNRHVTKDEQGKLEQVKDTTRKAVGVSLMTPKVSGSVGVAKTSGQGQDASEGTLEQSARLTWDAHGGDTLLASNPTAWASTVKNPSLWRLMNQHRIVDLFKLIENLDISAFRNLSTPSAQLHVGADIMKDEEANSEVRFKIGMALENSEDASVGPVMQRFYDDNDCHTEAGLKGYSEWLQKYYPEAADAKILPGLKFSALEMDQQIYFGLYMVTLGKLKVD